MISAVISPHRHQCSILDRKKIFRLYRLTPFVGVEAELRDIFLRERFISPLQREQWVGNDRKATCLRLEKRHRV